MNDDGELMKIASVFQRVLSGQPTPDDLEFCRTQEALQAVLGAALIPGESEEEGSNRLVEQFQGTKELRRLAKAGGDYFDAGGRCLSVGRARKFLEEILAVSPPFHLAPKALVCGHNRTVRGAWNDVTFHHPPNYGAWTMQFVCDGELMLNLGAETLLCTTGDLIVTPPQATTSHRSARDSGYYEEFWFNFSGSSRWLQWMDWIPHLSKASVHRGADDGGELRELAHTIIALNGEIDGPSPIVVGHSGPDSFRVEL